MRTSLRVLTTSKTAVCGLARAVYFSMWTTTVAWIPMTTLLIQNAYIVTMDDRQREIPDGGLFIRDGFIEQVSATRELPSTADAVLDLTDHLVLPGLVNTHHHFYQTLTRALPAAPDANLFTWLTTLYPLWARLTPEDIFTRAGKCWGLGRHRHLLSLHVQLRIPALEDTGQFPVERP